MGDDDYETSAPPIFHHIRSLLAEFVGTFVLVFAGSMSFQITSAGPIGPAFAHGFAIALGVIAFGHISGAHFNPAVTLGILICGEINAILALFYVLAQMLGAFVAGLFVRASLTKMAYMAIGGGTNNINLAQSNVGNAIVTEAIITFVLVNVVLNAAVDSGGSNVLAPMGIGMAIVIGILTAGVNTGASINPARSFGPAASYSIFYDNTTCPTSCKASSDVWKYHYVHWVGPLIGGAIAAVFYKLFFAKNGKRWILN